MDLNINQFGSLTTQNGKKLTFKDFDKNNDGEITKSEYDSLLKEVKLDTLDFASVDNDGNKSVTQDEFELWEQKIQMQEIVNNKLAEVMADTSMSKYAATIRDELKDYMECFIVTYKDDVNKMAEKFKASLESKYKQIKQTTLSNDPAEIKDRVLDNILANISPELVQQADKLLDKEADRFIKNYTGSNLEADLRTHLQNYLNQSDSKNMSVSVSRFNQTIASLGAHLSDSDKAKAKEAVTEVLNDAIAQGIVLKIGKHNITGEASIKSLIASYADINSLIDDVKAALYGLSDEPKINLIKSESDAAEAAQSENALKSLKGSELTVNIDGTTVPGYFSNKKVKIKGQGKEGAVDDACKFLESTLKQQLKTKITNILREKGISFDQIANIFENVFSNAVLEAANECVTGKHGTWIRKSSSKFYTKELVDSFMTKFNAGIAEAIDAKNASTKDFDVIDMDLTVIGKDEEGNDIAEHGEDFAEAYKTGKVLTTKKNGPEYYVGIAAKILEGLKAQLLQKAKAMCAANGVTFNQAKFDEAFDSAKSAAVNASVTGSNSSHGSWKRAGIIAGSGAAAGIGTGLFTGLVGTVSGAAAGIIAGAISLAFGHHSKSNLDVRMLIDTFLQNFNAEYTSNYKK